MKKNIFVLFIAMAFISLFSSGCDKTQQPYNLDQPGAVATVTPSASALYVAVMVQTGSGTTMCSAALATGSSTGTGVAGATITINGETLTDSGGGVYMLVPMAAVINAGATVTLNITSSAGNASASGVMPASPGGMTTVSSITGAATGSAMILSNP